MKSCRIDVSLFSRTSPKSVQQSNLITAFILKVSVTYVPHSSTLLWSPSRDNLQAEESGGISL